MRAALAARPRALVRRGGLGDALARRLDEVRLLVAVVRAAVDEQLRPCAQTGRGHMRRKGVELLEHLEDRRELATLEITVIGARLGQRRLCCTRWRRPTARDVREDRRTDHPGRRAPTPHVAVEDERRVLCRDAAVHGRELLERRHQLVEILLLGSGLVGDGHAHVLRRARSAVLRGGRLRVDPRVASRTANDRSRAATTGRCTFEPSPPSGCSQMSSPPSASARSLAAQQSSFSRSSIASSSYPWIESR